jgi:hypothetical protein
LGNAAPGKKVVQQQRQIVYPIGTHEHAVLCCALLCCAVLCLAVCAVLCCALQDFLVSQSDVHPAPNNDASQLLQVRTLDAWQLLQVRPLDASQLLQVRPLGASQLLQVAATAGKAPGCTTPTHDKPLCESQRVLCCAVRCCAAL